MCPRVNCDIATKGNIIPLSLCSLGVFFLVVVELISATELKNIKFDCDSANEQKKMKMYHHFAMPTNSSLRQVKMVKMLYRFASIVSSLVPIHFISGCLRINHTIAFFLRLAHSTRNENI